MTEKATTPPVPKKRRASALPFRDEKTRAIFLGNLAGPAAGNAARAAEMTGINVWTAYRWAQRHEDFAKQMEAAQATGERTALVLLEREVERRAVQGVDEPVYQKGELVGHIRRYSDNLLMFRTKKLDPSYRDRPPDSFVAGNVQVVVSSFLAQASPAPLPSAPAALEEKNP